MTVVRRLIEITTLVVLVAACGKRDRHNPSPEDAALRQKLVGAWITGEEKPGIGWPGGVTTMHRDGTYSFRYTNRWEGGSRRFAYEGTWAVQGRGLVYTYTKTSEPKHIPVGTTQRCEIVRLTDDEMAIRDLWSGLTNIWVSHRSKDQ